MNRDEDNGNILRYRVDEIAAQIETLQASFDKASRRMTEAVLVLAQLEKRTEENRKTMRAIWASVIAGVLLLLATTIVAKLT